MEHERFDQQADERTAVVGAGMVLPEQDGQDGDVTGMEPVEVVETDELPPGSPPDGWDQTAHTDEPGVS